MNTKRYMKKSSSGLSLLFSGLIGSILTFSSLNAVGAESIIQCDDINDLATCEIIGAGGFNEEIGNIVENLVSSIRGQNNVNDACRFVGSEEPVDPVEPVPSSPPPPSSDGTPSGSEGDLPTVGIDIPTEGPGNGDFFAGAAKRPVDYVCDLGLDGGLNLNCDLDETARTMSCTLGDLDYFTMNCEAGEGNGGSCILSSDEESIAEDIEAITESGLLRDVVRDFSVNLIAGCALRGGTAEFQSDCDRVLEALNEGDNEAVARTLESIAPLNATDAIDSTFFTIGTQLSHVTNRLSRLRQASRNKQKSKDDDQLDASQLKFFDGQQWVKVGDVLAANDTGTISDVSPPSTFDDFSRLGFFIDGSIIGSEKDDSDEEVGADIDTQLLTWGVDYRFSDDLIGGVAFSFSSSDVEFGRNRGELEDTGYLLMAYGSFYRGNWFVDASIGLGGDEYDQTRNIFCDNTCTHEFDQEATARYSGEQLAISINAGYNWYHQAWTVMPYAQLTSVTVDIDGYRESLAVTGASQGDGSGFGLELEDQSRESLSLILGTQVSYAMSQSWGVWIPYLDLQIFNEFNDDAQIVRGRFIGNLSIDRNFEMDSNALDTDYYLIGIGSSFQMKQGNAAYLNITTMQGNDFLDQTVFTAGWRWEI